MRADRPRMPAIGLQRQFGTSSLLQRKHECVRLCASVPRITTRQEMTTGAGSRANQRCPRCQSAQTTIALETKTTVFCRCDNCRHNWILSKDEESSKGSPQPDRKVS